jgi:hypothetical protein
MGLHHVLWRSIEGRSLPCHLQLGARCRWCGCELSLRFRLTRPADKPQTLRCGLCENEDVHVISAKVLSPSPGPPWSEHEPGRPQVLREGKGRDRDGGH